MATSRPMDSLPLPVRIFHTAMQRQMPLDAYASTLDVPADALRALLTAQAGQFAPEHLQRLAAAHGQRAEAGLASLAEVVAAESFSAWLERNMEGISQTSLRARVKLEAPLLRAFLSGKALPDADQAERIARALYIDSAEMARVIVADMARRAERPPGPPARGQEAGAAAAVGERAPAGPLPASPGAPAPARARRRRSPDASDAPPAAASNESGPALTDLPPGDADIAAPPSGRRPRGPARASAAPTAEAVPMVAGSPDGEKAAAEEQATPARARTAPGAEADTPAAPAGRRRGRPAAAQAPPAPPADLPAADEPAPAAQPAARARGRPARGRAAALGDPAASPAPAAHEGAALQPAAPRAPTDGGDSAGAIHGSPADQARTSAGLPAAPPPTMAAVRSAETTLQLSPDEVRLIRIWRRLHPHGRRATLQYIGSLLVEE